MPAQKQRMPAQKATVAVANGGGSRCPCKNDPAPLPIGIGAGLFVSLLSLPSWDGRPDAAEAGLVRRVQTDPNITMAHLPHGLRVPEAGQQTTKKRPYSGKVRSFSCAPAGAICNHGMRFPRLRVASGRSIGQRKSKASRRSPGRLHPRSCQNSLRPARPAGLWQGARSDEVPAAGRAALRDSRLPTNRPRAAITPA